MALQQLNTHQLNATMVWLKMCLFLDKQTLLKLVEKNIGTAESL